VSVGSVSKATKLIKFHLYTVTIVHELEPTDVP
jgi:hypothetical protein